ncbi:AsmA family protein [Vibrio sp. E150_011]
MIRKTIAILIALFALGLIAILALFALLHTQYANPIVTQTINKLFNIKVTSESIHYQYPNQFDFINLRIEAEGEKPIEANSMSVWLGMPVSTKTPLRIHELLLSGSTLSNHSLSLAHQLSIENLALDHIDYSNNDVIINDLQLQLRHVQYNPDILLTKGELQLRASQIYYQGESIKDVLIDGELKGQNSKIYGASFIWNEANISTQAQYENNTWSLVNTTIEKLDIDLTSQLFDKYAALLDTIGHINSLDVLRSNVRYKDSKIENLNASFENIDLRESIWSQVDAYLSFDADSIQYQNLSFIEPTIDVNIDGGVVNIKDVDTTLEQGRIQFTGLWQQHVLSLEKLTIDGVKLYEEDQQDSILALYHYLPLVDINSLKVKRLTINRGQWIQLQQQPNWQVTGFNLTAEDLELKRNGQWGLWQGKAAASANSVSIGSVKGSQVALETESQDGKWQLSRLFVPYDKGYLDINASLDFSTTSQPLQIKAKAYSLPLALLQYVQPSDTIDARGTADIDLSIDVLIADTLTFSRTLTGELTAVFNGVEIATENSTYTPVEASPFHLLATRGVLSLKPFYIQGARLSGSASGNIDLGDSKTSNLPLKLTDECQATLHINLLTGVVDKRTQITCPHE